MKIHAVKAWRSEFQLPELWWKATCPELASIIPELLQEGRKKVVAGKCLGILGPGNLLCAAEKKIIKEVLSQMRKEVKRNIQNCPLASRRLLETHAYVHTHKKAHTHTHKLRWGRRRICSVIWAYFARFIFTEEESPPGSDLPSFKKVETGYGLINLCSCAICAHDHTYSEN